AWASNTTPAGVTSSPPDIVTYVDALTCGVDGGPCCLAPSVPCPGRLTCQAQFCAPCGKLNQPCCAAAPACDAALTCNGTVCSCGNGGGACCGGNNCSPGLVCDGGKCACGGTDQPCCAQGQPCQDGLVCSPQVQCITACGHQGQQCCNGTTCNAGLTC